MEFLLSVRADPNAKSDKAKGDVLAPRAHASALHQALAIRDVAVAKKTCLLLLLHKANPHATYAPYVHGRQRLCLAYEDSQTEGMSVHAQLQRAGSALPSGLRHAVSMLISQYRNVQRPVHRSPCGSQDEYARCHGALMGAALHPKSRCPCKGPKGKAFGKCCMKLGPGFWRAPLGSFVQRRKVDGLSERSRILMEQMNKNMFGKPNGFPQMDKEMFDKLQLQLVYSLVVSGEVDPAFAFASLRCDFPYAHPWRSNNVAIIDRSEMNLRQREWNDFVDEYVACRDSPTPLCAECKDAEGKEVASGIYKGRRIVKEVGACRFGADARSVLETAKAAKISWTGGPLYSTCGNPACGKQEEEPSEFQLCSKCKQTRFCSTACFKAAWKPVHKQVCGTSPKP